MLIVPSTLTALIELTAKLSPESVIILVSVASRSKSIVSLGSKFTTLL